MPQAGGSILPLFIYHTFIHLAISLQLRQPLVMLRTIATVEFVTMVQQKQDEEETRRRRWAEEVGEAARCAEDADRPREWPKQLPPRRPALSTIAIRSGVTFP